MFAWCMVYTLVGSYASVICVHVVRRQALSTHHVHRASNGNDAKTCLVGRAGEGAVMMEHCAHVNTTHIEQYRPQVTCVQVHTCDDNPCLQMEACVSGSYDVCNDR